MTFTVNGRRITLMSRHTVSYEMLCELAYTPGTPSITYKYPGGLKGGILTPGDRVTLVEGMRFDVYPTGNA